MPGPRSDVLPAVPLAGGLWPAILEADALRDRYYRAVGEQSLIRNGASLALVPIGAAALALGITGTSRNVLAGLGAGGAALYGGASLVGDSGRQRVWLAGSRALGCAVLSMVPLMRTKDELRELRAAADRLASAISGLDAVATAEDAVPLARARVILAGTRSLAIRVEISGALLLLRVRDIRDQVSEQILRTEPDPATVLAATTRLSGIAGTLAPGGFPAVTAPGRPAYGFAGQVARTPREELASAAGVLASVLDEAAAAERVFRASEQCGPLNGSAVLRLVAATDVLDLVPGTSADLPLRGAGIPTVAVSGAVGVSAERLVVVDSIVVRVRAALDAVGGDRILTISDQEGRETARLVVRVPGAAAAGSVRVGASFTGTTRPERRASTAESGSVLPPTAEACRDLGKLRVALHVPPDMPTTHPEFPAAVWRARVNQGLAGANARPRASDSVLDAELCQRLLATSTVPPQATGSALSGATPGQPASPDSGAAGQVPAGSGGPGKPPEKTQ